MTGMVESSKTSSGEVVLTERTNTTSSPYRSNGTTEDINGNIYAFKQSVVSAKTRDLSNAFVGHTVTTTVLDFYGNPGSMLVETYDSTGAKDGYSKLTDSTFINDTVNWLLGRLTCTTMENTDPEGNTRIRRSGFSYGPTNERLLKEVLEPDSADCISPTSLSMVTEYGYGDYGNKSSIKVSGTGITSRTTTNVYDYSQLLISTLIMRHAIAGPSAAGMLLSSLQGCICSVICNSMSHN